MWSVLAEQICPACRSFIGIHRLEPATIPDCEVSFPPCEGRVCAWKKRPLRSTGLIFVLSVVLMVCSMAAYPLYYYDYGHNCKTKSVLDCMDVASAQFMNMCPGQEGCQSCCMEGNHPTCQPDIWKRHVWNGIWDKWLRWREQLRCTFVILLLRSL